MTRAVALAEFTTPGTPRPGASGADEVEVRDVCIAVVGASTRVSFGRS
jgi:hypothetical protein